MTPQKSPDGRDIDADGWITWEGGSCPVPPEAVTQSRLRDGRICHPIRADLLEWRHEDHPSDIVAYRVVDTLAQPRASVDPDPDQPKTLRDELAIEDRAALRVKLLAALDGIATLDAFRLFTPRERALVAILQAMFHGGIV